MATAAESISSSAISTTSVSSPRYRRSHRPQPDPSADEIPLFDQSDASVAGDWKRSAWNKPSNGAVEIGPVMDAVSWPALSEAARTLGKPASSEVLTCGLSEGSATPVTSPAPVIINSPLKQTAEKAQNHSFSNHVPSTRQKSMKKVGGGGSGSSIAVTPGFPNGGLVSPSMPSLGPVQVPSAKSPVAELSPRELSSPNKNSGSRDHGQRSGGISPQAHGGNEHHRAYSGNHRRGSNGGGNDGGPHHGAYGGRRNHQDRGGHDWNSQKNYSSRDSQMQQQRPLQSPFILPPVPGSPTFIGPPPPIRTFGSPMGFPEIYYISAPSPPFVGPPPMYFAATADPQLQTILLHQIEYYFSPDNLCRDIYLRQNMDEEGWVPVSLIAAFNRVKQFTNNVQFILETVRTSTVLEINGDKIRRRTDWMHWLWPQPANHSVAACNSASPTQLNEDTLAAHMRSLGLKDGSTNSMRAPVRADLILGRSSSGELDNRSAGAPHATGQIKVETESGPSLPGAA